VTLTSPTIELPRPTAIADQQGLHSGYARAVTIGLPLLPEPQELAELIAEADCYRSHGWAFSAYPLLDLTGPYEQLLRHVNLAPGLDVFAVHRRSTAAHDGWDVHLLCFRNGPRVAALHHSDWDVPGSSLPKLTRAALTEEQQKRVDAYYKAVVPIL
jgi:hypothetical protein